MRNAVTEKTKENSLAISDNTLLNIWAWVCGKLFYTNAHVRMFYSRLVQCQTLDFQGQLL